MEGIRVKAGQGIVVQADRFRRLLCLLGGTRLSNELSCRLEVVAPDRLSDAGRRCLRGMLCSFHFPVRVRA
jgi:hypothetical protein